MKRVLIAVIAYNEEKNLANTLKDLREHGPKNLDIVVIDNGSSDRTKAVALAAGVPVVSHCVNSGSSMGTVMSYFLYAHRNRYDCLCQFDGDGQHMGSELHKIIDPVLEGRADYVIGSRFLAREGFQSYFFRRIGIRLFAALDSLVVGQKLTDVTSGFRAYSPRVLEFFAQHHRHELSDTNQLLLLSYFAGARLLEVPVTMRARVHGVSEFRSTAAIVFPLKGVVNILGCLLPAQKDPQNMGLKIKLIAFLVGMGFFFFILRSIRGNAMRPSYAVLWTGISLFLVSISIFEPAYQFVAGSVIGIVDARHVIYIVLIGFLLVYVFYLTQKISKMSDQIQVILSQLAILEDEQRKGV